MNSSANHIQTLLGGAASVGVLSPESASLLTGNLGSVVIAGAAGTAMEDIQASDVTLITVLIDASSSIESRGLEQAVREGENALIEAFAGSQEKDAILLALWTFNEQQRVIHSYVPVSDATRLDRNNYRGLGSTALYDTWCLALGANVAYAQQLRDGGTPTRSVVVVITDGEDCGSKRTTAECARLSRDLLASEQFVLAFVGVGSETDFKRVAKEMGIPDGSVAVQSQASAASLRRVFQMVSQSAIRASQGRIKPGANAGFFGP